MTFKASFEESDAAQPWGIERIDVVARGDSGSRPPYFV